MKYRDHSFSVGVGSDAYRANYAATFGKVAGSNRAPANELPSRTLDMGEVACFACGDLYWIPSSAPELFTCLRCVKEYGGEA